MSSREPQPWSGIAWNWTGQVLQEKFCDQILSMYIKYFLHIPLQEWWLLNRQVWSSYGTIGTVQSTAEDFNCDVIFWHTCKNIHWVWKCSQWMCCVQLDTRMKQLLNATAKTCTGVRNADTSLLRAESLRYGSIFGTLENLKAGHVRLKSMEMKPVYSCRDWGVQLRIHPLQPIALQQTPFRRADHIFIYVMVTLSKIICTLTTKP